MYTDVYHSPVGPIVLISDGLNICGAKFTDAVPEALSCVYIEVLDRAVRQLDEYFARSRTRFDLPVVLNNVSDFDRRVYAAVSEIGYGKTRTYAQTAVSISRDSREGRLLCRAVGNALRRNPLHLIIPCHRVIRADGSVGGYAGREETKRYLLDLESSPHG